MKQLKAVNRSLVLLKKQLRAAVKEINNEAADLVGRGRYDASSALIDVAKRAGEFSAEVEALRKRWTSIRRGPTAGHDGERTPLWEYYALIASALVHLEGEATRSQITDWISGSAIDKLKPADLARTARGKLIWQRNVNRARKAMIKEGYLEPDSGSIWKLTRLGRDIAKQKSS